MASSTTQSIGAAAPSAVYVPPSPALQRQIAQPQNPEQVAQITQAVTQQLTTKAKPGDENRSAQVPKRVEGSPLPHRNRAKPQRSAPAETDEDAPVDRPAKAVA